MIIRDDYLSYQLLLIDSDNVYHISDYPYLSLAQLCFYENRIRMLIDISFIAGYSLLLPPHVNIRYDINMQQHDIIKNMEIIGNKFA